MGTVDANTTTGDRLVRSAGANLCCAPEPVASHSSASLSPEHTLRRSATVAALIAYIPMLGFLYGNPYAYFLYRFEFATLLLLALTFLVLPAALFAGVAAAVRQFVSAAHAQRVLLAVLLVVLWRQIDLLHLRPAAEAGSGLFIREIGLVAALVIVGLALTHGRKLAVRWLDALFVPVLVVALAMTGIQVYRVYVTSSTGGDAHRTAAPAPNNIFIVLIDGFPLSYVQDADGFLDARIAPNLDTFARTDAIWAPANFANGTSTLVSVPSMMTGRLSAVDASGFGRQRNSLLELASASYRVTAFVPSLNITCLPARYRCYPPQKPGQVRLAIRMVAANYFEMTEPRLGRILTGPPVNWTTLPFENAGTWDVLPAATALVRQEPRMGHFMLVHTFFQEPARAQDETEQQRVREAVRAVKAWDESFGDFLETLRTTGLYETSVVAVVSDHGKDFAQRAQYGPDTVPNERILRTVMAIKPLGSSRPAVVSTPTQNVDLLPTIADLAGWTLPPNVTERLHGQSLASPDYEERNHYFLTLGQGRFQFDRRSGAHTRVTGFD